MRGTAAARRHLIPALTCAIALSLPALAAAQADYRFTQVSTQHSPADHVNDHGTVVGYDVGAIGTGINGYLWTKGGGKQVMVGDFASFPQAPHVRISLRNVIASTGCPVGCTGVQSAIVRPGTNMVTFLGNVAGDTSNTASAINGAETVVGVSSGGGGGNRPFIYTPVGGIRALDGFGSAASGAANDVNEWNLVTGYASGLPGDMDSAPDAFIWFEPVGPLMLPKLFPGVLHEAFAVNNAGQVVGRYVGDADTRGVFLWSLATGITVNLNAPAGTAEDLDINDRGEIVATILVAGVGRVPYLYRNGTWTDLNTLVPAGTPLQLETATAINNKGWIVGAGFNPGPTRRGYVLQPPTVELTANFLNGPVTLRPGFPMVIDLAFDPVVAGGFPSAELFLGLATDTGVVWFTGAGPSSTPIPIFTGLIVSLGLRLFDVPDVAAIPPGRYRFFAIIDRTANGVLDGDFYDVVEVNILGAAGGGG